MSKKEKVTSNLIDETVEVKHILEGKFSKQNLYNIYYLLVRYYNEQGLEASEIRKNIFDWANSHELFVSYKLNVMIDKSIGENRKLSKNVAVYINDDDVKNIKSLFDLKRTRLTALGILCYAKIHANKNSEFSISSCALGAWLNIYHTNLRDRYIKELCTFGYLSKVETPSNNKKWAKSDSEKSTKYKINVNIENYGKYKLIDNNIELLYEELF